jgi:hypothetical protein
MPRINLLRAHVALVLALLALGAGGGSASAAQPLFPDLKSLPPRSLHLSQTDTGYDGGGSYDYVLRFSNTVWNAGPGPLDLRGRIDPDTQRGPAYQRVFDTEGGHVDYPIGSDFYYHPAHHHFHLDDWGRYELWKRADYDAWIAGGRTSAGTPLLGHKISSCALDDEFVAGVPGAPAYGEFQFSGCSTDANGDLAEGLAPGWGDTYDYTRYDQWIDIGSNPLPDGDYVLRSVMDPLNKIYESADRSGSAQESQQDNEATTPLTVRDGKLVDVAAPTGSVQINNVDLRTASSKVRVSVMGRDDVSGVTQFRVSGDGRSWRTYAYGGGDTSNQGIAWDLADTRYGGSAAGGTRSVFVQFADKSGRWGPVAKDTIDLTACASSTGAPSPYAGAVLADRPVSFWRLGETCGAVAGDARASNPGVYASAAGLGAPGLLADELGSTGVALESQSQWVRVPSSPSLDVPAGLTLEAWVKPRALPTAGTSASIVSKPGAYALEFDGPRLQLTLVRGRTHYRVRAPVGAVHPGGTYHVAGTFDGRIAHLYVNGHMAGSAPGRSPDATTSSLFLGAWDEGVALFSGTLDEVAVYGKALTTARVAAHRAAALPPPALPAPSNLKAAAGRGRRVTVTWADDASHESGLLLERSPDRRFRHPAHRHLRAHTTTFTDVHTSPGRVYWYRLRAYTATHISAWSKGARVRTRALHPR